jgi:energy-coupling factor transporter transmembrane protein EcfT
MAHTAFHPAVHIILGLSLIVLSSALGHYTLLAAILILAVWLFLRRDAIALRWIRRARYLLIIPPLLSGYVIPGTGILPLDVWAPTWEGLAVGLTQSMRLLFAILALRVSLRGLSSAQLADGFVRLLAPLALFGLEVDQAARRLTLTLHYVGQFDGYKVRDLLLGLQEK